MTLLLFSVIALVIAIAGRYIFGEIGVAITAFLLGLCGFFVYPLLIAVICWSFRLVSGKKFFSGKWFLRIAALVCSVFLIVHLATSARFFGGGYGEYLGGCWNAASESAADATGAGIIFGLIVYPVSYAFSEIGAYVLFSLFTALSVFFILWATPLKGKLISSAKKPKPRKQPRRTAEKEDFHTSGIREYPGSFAFDDLETPQSVPRDYAAERNQQPQYQPQPDLQYRPRYEQPRETASDGYERSNGSAYDYAPPAEPYQPTGRDILFSSDPAADYNSNLIFNRDSAFNSRTRRSSIEPDDSPARRNDYSIPSVYEKPLETRRRETGDQSGAKPPQSYRSAYGEQAETVRSSMPRKIVEQKPDAQDGFTLRSADLNYPQLPSYKAPEISDMPARDFYANDVAPEFNAGKTDGSPYLGLDGEETSEAGTPPDAEPAEFPSTAPNDADSFAFDRNDNAASRFPEESVMKSSEDAIRAESKIKRAPLIPKPEPIKSEPDRSAYTNAEFPARGVEEISEARAERNILRGDDFGNEFKDRASARLRGEPKDGFGLERSIGFGEDSLYDAPQDAFDDGRGQSESRVERGMRKTRVELFEEDGADDAAEPAEPLRYQASRIDGVPERPAHPIPKEAAPEPKKHVYKKYKYPSLQLFRQYDDAISVSQEEIIRNSDIIIETLAGFRVEAEIVKVTPGPSVTRYDIDIPRNISVRSVIKHDEEIAMRLHARDGVNIYSNSEVGAISIEVPNSVRAVVGIRSVMQSEEYRNSKPGSLMFAIGKDVEGRNVCGNIAKMTHILVAGSTNSGKSVCLNSMLVSLICKYSPQELRLILIDPKKVEFTIYDGLPHLMINEIIADAQKAVSALNWAIKEMERRYLVFEQKTRSGVVVRNLDEYNSSLADDEEKLAKIVIVVDELADLMSVAKKDIEERIQRLTQKARAAGIHLVIATQRPSVDVITGVIKGNLPTRMAFRVIQEVDSRTILDESGAEKLLGNGDMLYKTGGMFNCMRVQGAFLSSEEVQAVVEEIKANNEAFFDPEIADYINKTEAGDSGFSDGDEGESEAVNAEYIKALAVSVKLGTTSISLIQRKCSVGYNHAGKIIEWMELMGYITPFDGKAKARTVLLTKEEYESKYGSLD